MGRGERRRRRRWRRRRRMRRRKRATSTSSRKAREDEKEAAVQNGPKGKVGKEEEARRKRLREHPLTGKFWRQLDTYDAGLQRQEKLHQIIGMLKERRGNFQR